MSRTRDEAYKRKRRRLLRETDGICWLCGEEIDMTLVFPDPMSFSADHVYPVGEGNPNAGPLMAAHLRCNQRRGKGTKDIRHMREW
ncbi:HNH endonuclease [Gordonia phage Keelan]|nr:HNH endonuclease [Gordonia phage Keelan]